MRTDGRTLRFDFHYLDVISDHSRLLEKTSIMDITFKLTL
jgi:hypothetical protein